MTEKEITTALSVQQRRLDCALEHIENLYSLLQLTTMSGHFEAAQKSNHQLHLLRDLELGAEKLKRQTEGGS